MKMYAGIINSVSFRGIAPNITMKVSVIVMLLLAAIISPIYAQTGLYTLNGGTASETTQTYAATLEDQSAIYVLNSGNLTLVNCTMTKTGDASDVNNSSQYGVNAGILAEAAGVVVVSGGSVATDASGANGLFATSSGSSITMSNGTIIASGASAHGVDVTYGGTITLTNVDVTSTGASSSALATDYGGGTVTVTGGTIVASDTASGSHSAGIYSTGSISVTDAAVTSVADCGGVIDGANSISLMNTTLTGLIEGIKIWNTAPSSDTANVTIDGGSLTVTAGDGFYITGEAGNAAIASISVTGGAVISASTGNIINVISSSSASFIVDTDTLTGNMIADTTSTLDIILQNSSSLTGNIQEASVSIDSSSVWTLTANSILIGFVDPDGISGLTVTNVIGNGYSVHYDSSLSDNDYLDGLTYSLVNGGELTPGAITDIDDQSSSLPDGYTLDQNFPNPFNAQTTIKYYLPSQSSVLIEIYDILGRMIESIDEGEKQAGEYKIIWNAGNLPSGVYFYRIQAGEFCESKKMTLLK